jgi:RHS repeat-associated protein
MDLDYTYGYLKIFASVGGSTLNEYTEFAGAVPSWTKSYTYLGSSQLSTITPNGSGGEITEYNHPDRLGVRTVTNQTTGTSYEQTTLPFGTALNAETTRSESKRFTSYERSARTGLDYAVNRTYDSKLGRFTQVDPIGMSAVSLGSPQTLNLYTYCGNDPVNHVDPDGLFFGKLFRAIGKIFKAVNKILKWIVIAVAIALIVAAVILTNGGALPAFLGDGLGWLLGMIGKIGAGVSSFMAATIGVEVGASIGTTIAAGLYGVGSLASNYIGKKSRKINRNPNRRTLCLWKDVKITFYDSPKGNTAIGGKKPQQGISVAADPTVFGYPYPRGTRDLNAKNIRQESQKDLKKSRITFDISIPRDIANDQNKLLSQKGLSLDNLVFEDVGGGVKGDHIDVYVDSGAKQLGTFRADVIVSIPFGWTCPVGMERIYKV